MSLSPSQEKARDEFLKFLSDPNQQVFTISGPAGSGKTYLVRHLLDIAYSENKLLTLLDSTENELQIYLSATTNKAVDVLSDSTPEFTCRTIHKLLGLTVMNDYKTGKTYLSDANSRSRINLRNAILVIDEASMINQELFEWIQAQLNKFSRLKIIFIGDKYQLPPVMERCSPVFTKTRNIVYLSEIIRQKNTSTILPVAQAFRNTMDVAGKWPIVENSENITVHTDPKKWLHTIDQAFLTNATPDHNRVLAWSNNVVRQYNRHIMGTLNIADELAVGNWLTMNSRIASGRFTVETDGRCQVIQEKIKDKITGRIRISKDKEELFEIPVWNLKVKHKLNEGFVSVPIDWNHAHTILKQLAKHKDWKNYFNLKEMLADLRPMFAQTCHKSQGSTYDTVFVDLQDVSRNNKWLEVAQLVYTAMTRASNHVHFYGHLPEKWAKEKKESLEEVFSYVKESA